MQTFTPLPVWALCAPCRYTWLQTPAQDNCPICTQPPSAAIPFLPVEVAAGEGSPPPAPGGGATDEGPFLVHGECPRCEADLTVTITSELITFTLNEPTPAGGDGAHQLEPGAPGEAPPSAESERTAAGESNDTTQLAAVPDEEPAPSAS